MARFRNYGRQRRGLTAAQEAAHKKAWDACDHTVNGRFAKGCVVADWGGQTWKIMTYGVAYHEDVSGRLYGVKPCRGPKGWAETRQLREAIAHVRSDGTHEPGTAGGLRKNEAGEWINEQQPRPEGAAIAEWRDGRAGSLASFPTLTVYEGGIVGVQCPIYDDAPIVAWVRDAKLAARLAKAIAACPAPVSLPEVTVAEKAVTLKIDETHPRFAAYMAGRGAERLEAISDLNPAAVRLPVTEYRRIKAELDAAEPQISK